MYLALKEKGRSKSGKSKQGPLVKEGYRSVYRFFSIASEPRLTTCRQALAGMALDGEE